MEADPEAASVVKKVFEWRVLGKSCSWIAKYLNDLAIPSPGLYRYMEGGQSFKKCHDSKWKAENVSGILENPVYLGHMIQGKSKHSHFRNDGKKERVPKKDWIAVEDTHQPLILQEQFDAVANMAAESRRKYEERMNAHADIPHIENPLRKKVFCGKCGMRMFRRRKVENGVRNYYYYCDTRRRKLNTECNQPYMKEERLMNCIRSVVKKQLQLLGKWQSEENQKKSSEEDAKKNHWKTTSRNILHKKSSTLKMERRNFMKI